MARSGAWAIYAITAPVRWLMEVPALLLGAASSLGVRGLFRRGADPMERLRRQVAARGRHDTMIAAREARYRAVVETSRDGFLMVDAEGRVRDVNDTYARLSGYKREELLRMRAADLVVDPDTPDLGCRIARLMREGSRLYESHHRARDGRIWVAEVTAAYAPAENCIFAFVRDVTQRHASARALRESEHRYRSLFTHSPDAVIVSQHGCVAMANDSCARLLGGPNPQALIGRPVLDLFEPEFRATMTHRIAGLREDGARAAPLEHAVRHADGHPIPVEVVAAGMRLGGEPAVLVILRDIRERRLAEQRAFEAATAEQERIGREIHDGIGQRLTALGMFAHSLEQHLRATRDQQGASDAATILAHLRGTLRDARSLARGLAPTEVDGVTLPSLIRDMVDDARSGSGLRCTANLENCTDHLDDATASHLFRIAQEALHNAVRHSGGDTINVLLRRERRGLVLSVSDNGRGGVRPRAGSLGLSSMRQRAHAIGATLDITASNGTVVRCTVPAGAA